MMTLFIRRRTMVTIGLLGMCAAFIWFSTSDSSYDSRTRARQGEKQELTEKTANSSRDHDKAAVSGATGSKNPGLGISGSALAELLAQNGKNGSEFYSEYRLQRDRIRSQQIDLLREIVNNPNSGPETRRDAQQKLIVIAQNLEKEMELENLIIAKGFKDAIIFIQPSAVTIIVQGRSLAQEQLAKITDLAVRSLKVRPEDIVIVPKQ